MVLPASFSVGASFVERGLAWCRDVGNSDGSPARGVAHGDSTRGGSGSNVNMDAIYTPLEVYYAGMCGRNVRDSLRLLACCRNLYLMEHINVLKPLSLYGSDASEIVEIIVGTS
jgi:hypothetical protein